VVHLVFPFKGLILSGSQIAALIVDFGKATFDIIMQH
jgi:hypothetical protein